MTLALVSRVGLEQACMTDTLKFGPSVCLEARISDNPNISTQKYIYISILIRLEDDVNYVGPCTGSPLLGTQMATHDNMKAPDL